MLIHSVGRSQQVQATSRLTPYQADHADEENKKQNNPQVGVQKEVVEKSQDPDQVKLRSEVQKLVNREREVLAHERAHQSVGGDLTGAASYSYTIGPDGKRYISGGEVSLSIPASDDPDEMERIADRVKRAALAPAKPSAQDQSVASRASSLMAKARMMRASQAYEKDKPKESDNLVDLSV